MLPATYRPRDVPLSFSSLQMRSSLRDQLSLEELRREFEKFADSKVVRELPDFYKACLDREEITDFFERQAVTTGIIDRSIAVPLLVGVHTHIHTYTFFRVDVGSIKT